MADAHHDIEIPQDSSVFTPSPSTPLHLSGFLSGDTIQVQGDTGNLEFSVQFNIRNKLTSDNYFHYPDHTNHVFETQDSPISNASSSYMTPITNHEDDQCQDREINASLHSTDNGISEKEESVNEHNKYTIVTRLRSGVLKPVTSYGASIQENQSCRNKQKGKEKSMGKRAVLEKVIRGRSFPRRPCNSYTFFVIATWDMVKCSSFQGTSKKLSEMWCKMPLNEKKVFKDMALKDSARYNRQLVLLKNHLHE